MGITDENAQIKTQTRLKAEHDILNALSTMSMFSVVVKYVTNHNLFINFDATQFELCTPYSEHTRKVAVIAANLSEQKRKRLSDIGVDIKPLTAEAAKGNHDLKYYLKYYCIITASGILCDTLVFVAADPNMNDEDVAVYNVTGLSASATMNAYGYLVLCKSRSCNATFYKWLNISVILPFIDELKIEYADITARAAVYGDGESQQITPYLDDELINQFNARQTLIIMKNAASCTKCS